MKAAAKTRARDNNMAPAMMMLLAAFTTIFAITASGAVVVTEPSEVVFERESEPIAIRLGVEGEPIEQANIGGVRLLVDDVVYREEVDYRFEDGRILVNPIEGLEPGAYNLLIETDQGPAVVRVYQPASDEPMTLEEQAEILGITLTELEGALGYRDEAVEEPIAVEAEEVVIEEEDEPDLDELLVDERDLDVAPVMYRGQVVRLTPPETAREYEIRVDDRVLSGDQTEFIAEEPGRHVISYLEREDGKLVRARVRTVDVVERPQIVREYAPETEVTFEGPDGYSQYTWSVDGVNVGEGKTFTHSFTGEGPHRVEVVAEDPGENMGERYRAVAYSVIVQPQE